MSSTNLAEIQYRSNFITEVIARVDFLSPIHEVNQSLPRQISDLVIKNYPIPEPQPLVEHRVHISLKDAEVQKESLDAKEWKFFGSDRSKFLSIRPDAIILKYTKYFRFDPLRDEFLHVVEKFFSYFQAAQGRRLGLRYINNIRVDDGSPTSWDKFIKPNLLCIFKGNKEKELISRAFHNLELNYGDFNLRFQYGMHNPVRITPQLLSKRYLY